MAVEEKITCNGCSKEKAEANNWYCYRVLDSRKDRIEVEYPYATGFLGRIIFDTWNVGYAHYDGHVCGQACAVKILSAAMHTWEAVTNE